MDAFEQIKRDDQHGNYTVICFKNDTAALVAKGKGLIAVSQKVTISDFRHYMELILRGIA